MAFLGIMSEAAKLDWARAANTLNNEKWEPHSEEMLFRAMQIPRTPEMEKSPAFQLLLLEMAAVVADALEDPCPGNDIKAALVAQHVGVDMDALRVVRLEHIRAKLQERGVRTDSLPDVMEVVRKESPHLPHEGVCLVARAVVGEDDE